MVQTFTKDFENRVFSYTQMSATRSILMKLRVGQILGNALPYIVRAVGETDAQRFQTFMVVIHKVMQSNDPQTVLDLLKDITAMVHVSEAGQKSRAVIFDMDFTTELDTLYSVVFWVLKKEYSSFFAKLVKSEEAGQDKTNKTDSNEQPATSPE